MRVGREQNCTWYRRFEVNEPNRIFSPSQAARDWSTRRTHTHTHTNRREKKMTDRDRENSRYTDNNTVTAGDAEKVQFARSKSHIKRLHRHIRAEHSSVNL